MFNCVFMYFPLTFSGVKQAFACNLHTISLSCARGGKINITSAEYAQYKKSCSDTCCPPHPEDCKESMDETAPGDWNMLKSACNNKTSCRFQNPGDLLPSCERPYLSSYAMVYYSCSSGANIIKSICNSLYENHFWNKLRAIESMQQNYKFYLPLSNHHIIL